MLKFPNFRRHDNKGRSGVNFCDTDKLYDIDNPLIGATYLALCLILVVANFVLKFSHFRCHGNWGRSDVNVNDTSKLLDLEKHLFGATYVALVALFLVLAEF